MTAIEKARAFAASKAIDVPGRARVSPAEWQEWLAVAAELRKPIVRLDHRGVPSPMTWDEVTRWIAQEFPNARQYGHKTLRSKLSAKLRHAQSQANTTV